MVLVKLNTTMRLSQKEKYLPELAAQDLFMANYEDISLFDPKDVDEHLRGKQGYIIGQTILWTQEDSEKILKELEFCANAGLQKYIIRLENNIGLGKEILLKKILQETPMKGTIYFDGMVADFTRYRYDFKIGYCFNTSRQWEFGVDMQDTKKVESILDNIMFTECLVLLNDCRIPKDMVNGESTKHIPCPIQHGFIWEENFRILNKILCFAWGNNTPIFLERYPINTKNRESFEKEAKFINSYRDFIMHHFELSDSQYW